VAASCVQCSARLTSRLSNPASNATAVQSVSHIQPGGRPAGRPGGRRVWKNWHVAHCVVGLNALYGATHASVRTGRWWRPAAYSYYGDNVFTTIQLDARSTQQHPCTMQSVIPRLHDRTNIEQTSSWLVQLTYSSSSNQLVEPAWSCKRGITFWLALLSHLTIASMT